MKRTEQQIIRQWQGDNRWPLVSVECLVYQNEAHLEQALDSILAQETTFPFEIVIHDDASGDATPAIIRRYAEAYPGIIQAICQQENQLSRGITPDTFTSPRLRGRYVASCEGDDYWVDRRKLAKQVAMLEANPDCDLCFHAACRLDTESGDTQLAAVYGDTPRRITTDEIIERRHGTITTASVMVRRTVFPDYLHFMAEQDDKAVGDVYFQIMAAFRGGACYLPDTMSVYRYKVPGSWSANQSRNPQIKLTRLRHRIRSNERLDALSQGRFAPSFWLASRQLVLKGLKAPGLTADERQRFLRDFAHYLGPGDRLLAGWLRLCPGSLSLYRRMRAWLRARSALGALHGQAGGRG